MSESSAPTVLENPQAHHATRNAHTVGQATGIPTDLRVIVVGTTTGYHWQLWMGNHLLRMDGKVHPSFAEAEDDAKERWFDVFEDALCGPMHFGGQA